MGKFNISSNLINKLEKLKFQHESKLRDEKPGSYNHGYIAGEISGIRRTIDFLRNE